MLKQKTNKNGSFTALISISVLLLLIILLENLSDRIPGLPAVFLPTSQLFTVLKKGAVYSLVAVSMNLLNGFTGLFSLGQAGFMLLGAYTYAILTIPSADRESVYYLYGGSAVNFSLPELFGGGAVGLVLGVLLALFLGGCVAAAVAWLIGLPVLRLKSDYLAIATLGFAEIIRAIFQWDPLGPVTNGANALKNFPTFFSFGPQLVTPDEVPDVLKLEVQSVHNGQIHAKNTVEHMMHKPARLVSLHSSIQGWYAGDILSTGTPRAFEIKDGDMAECRIYGPNGFEMRPLVNPVVDLKLHPEKA